MRRVVLVLPTTTYRAADFVAAAAALGAEVVVASEAAPPLAVSVVVDLDDPDGAAQVLADLDDRGPVDAVVAVDDRGAVVAAAASARLGLPHNPPDAVSATRDKAEMRRRLATGEVPQPAFTVVPAGGDVAEAAAAMGFPVVVKPTGLSGSTGVIRADDAGGAAAAAGRIAPLWDGELLVERFVPGPEVAVEGLLREGELEVLAVFDKPDPLDGPFFEETIYVTPSRHRPAMLADLGRVMAAACAAVGLREGPVHGEARLSPGGPVVIEVAARSIGGLCSRALTFGAGVSLEEVILRHALGLPSAGLQREHGASGVMMLPIPRSGVFESVGNQDAARAVPGVAGLEITIAPGRTVRALPEGDRYLGFLFARAGSPGEVEDILRRASSLLEVTIS